MTPNLRAPRDSDARKIIDNAYETLGRIRAFHAHYSSLRIAIEARMVDGLGAADYDGEVRGTSELTPVERAASHRERDKAHDDLVTLQHAVRQLEDADNAIVNLIARYPLWGTGPDKGKAVKPGEGPCPADRCRDHWAAGLDVKVAKGRYATACRKCGEHRAEAGVPYPTAVLRAADEFGWDSWRVGRAMSAA